LKQNFQLKKREEKKITQKDVDCNVVDASVYDLLIPTSDCFFFLFSFDRVVSVWNSKKQVGITQSSIKVECVTVAAYQKIWLMKFEKMRSMFRVFSRKISKEGVLEIDIFPFY